MNMDIFWICVAVMVAAPHLANIIKAIKGDK